MGLTTIDGRRLAQMNDNIPKPKGGPEMMPISPEEWRHAPQIRPETGVQWFCLVTVPQQEYACCDGLSEAGVASYVPTETRWVDRRKGKEVMRVQVQSPIFRSYVFVRIASDRDWEPVYTTKLAKKAEIVADFARLSDEDRRYVEMLQAADLRNDIRRSPLHILGVVGAGGEPMPIPLRDLTSLSDEERAGWFNEDMRPALLKAERIAKLKAAQAAEALKEALKPKPEVMSGEKIRIVKGHLAGEHAVALNDNVKGMVRIMSEKLGRIVIPLSDVENLTRPKVVAGALRRASA
jgi:transcription antitermination factor NusG